MRGDALRSGAECFLQPSGATQRRYEALRAYLVDEMSAAEVADRFGYSTASVHQMATMLRTGKLRLLAENKPGPKGPSKATGRLREQILTLRAAHHSVTEIAEALTAAGTPISAQSVWRILDQQGLPRLPQRDDTCRGSPARLESIQATRLPGWPDEDVDLPCDHAGLLLLLPGMVDLNLHQLIDSCDYPATKILSAWHSIGAMLLAKCARRARAHHIDALTYSYRVHRDSNQRLLAGFIAALRPFGLATGTSGFNLDFHAIRHHGQDAILESHYVPKRSQRTRAVLTFFAQDHASAEMIYANADITKAAQSREILAFADYWKQATGAQPGLLVFDSQLTTYTVLDELTARGITWLTLRMRGKPNSPGSPRYPPPTGAPCVSTAPAATATPACTKTSSPSRTSTPRSARSPSPTSAANNPPC
jgi:transposase